MLITELESFNSRQRRTMEKHRFVLFVSSWFHPTSSRSAAGQRQTHTCGTETPEKQGEKPIRLHFPAELELWSSFRPGDSRPRGRELSENRRAQNVIARDRHLVPGGEAFEMAHRFLHASNL